MSTYNVTPSAKNDGIYLLARDGQRFVKGSPSKATNTLVLQLQAKVPGAGLVLVATTKDIADGLEAAAQAQAYPCRVRLHEAKAPQAERAPAKRCGDCKGTGYRPEFAHYEGGVCFTCDGTGVPKRKEQSPRQAMAAARAQAARYARRERPAPVAAPVAAPAPPPVVDDGWAALEAHAEAHLTYEEAQAQAEEDRLQREDYRAWEAEFEKNAPWL